MQNMESLRMNNRHYCFLSPLIISTHRELLLAFALWTQKCQRRYFGKVFFCCCCFLKKKNNKKKPFPILTLLCFLVCFEHNAIHQVEAGFAAWAPLLCSLNDLTNLLSDPWHWPVKWKQKQHESSHYPLSTISFVFLKIIMLLHTRVLLLWDPYFWGRCIK